MDDAAHVPGFKIHLLNCNSLHTKLSEIKHHLQDSSPDVFCLCETWLNVGYVPRFPNYNAEWMHRTGQRGGGLGILVRHGLQYTEVQLQQFPMGVLEVQAITLHMLRCPPISVLNIYNPNRDVSVPEVVHYISQLGPSFLLVGDLNAHTPLLSDTDIRSNVAGKTLESLLQDSTVCLINPFNMFTYVHRATGAQSCLDVCLSSPDLAPLLSMSPLYAVTIWLLRLL